MNYGPGLSKPEVMQKWSEWYKQQIEAGPPKMLPPRDPVSLPDLEKRLALLTKYGVRSYRDGMLSLDLDPTARSTSKKQDTIPYIPPP